MTWTQALAFLVPSLVTLAGAVIALGIVYVNALKKKLQADSAPGIASAVVATVEAAAKAQGGATGEEKKAEAVAILKQAGQTFAIGAVEQAVAKAKQAAEY